MIDITESTLFKFLDRDLYCYYGGSGRWVPGRWRSVRGPLAPCLRGLHLCRVADLVDWLAPQLWVAEAAGERIELNNKVVVRRARIVEPVETWNERTARLFAADCVKRVLPIYEQDHTDDPRLRHAIVVARAAARGAADVLALGDAERGAWSAARGHLGSLDAAYLVARAAALLARPEAEVAEVVHLTRRAAIETDRTDERRWQTERLLAYLRGEVVA